ncbi:LysR substrate-binding domain-containing protein [Planctomonas deserti]|uniref:LysR substrate-binding domain-containing protein n=1 Tax=Planctomonas deserti TaxID=2144185 RepID=UPI000D381524|nr:LysR substrate-binding domain-containing protein [Planctomonas deserti]
MQRAGNFTETHAKHADRRLNPINRREVSVRPSSSRDLSLTQLRYFVAAAEWESMTDAAASLYVAQSAVSTSIANLEDSLGTQLFIRRRAKGLLLTASGQELLTRARDILAAIDDAVDVLRPDTISGRLEAACFSTLAPFYLPEILHGMSTRFPELELQIRDLSADEINEAISTRAIEVALTYDLGLDPSIVRERLASVPVYAAVALDHPLAARTEVHLHELVEEPMVLLDLPVSRDYFLRAFTGLGLTPMVRHRFGSFEAVRSMVARGHGFTLLNQKPVGDYTYDGGRLHTLRVIDECPGMEIVIASASGPGALSRKARVFAEQCRRTLRAAGHALEEAEGTGYDAEAGPDQADRGEQANPAHPAGPAPAQPAQPAPAGYVAA